MKILALESSCDETSASVVEQENISNTIIVHSNVISSSIDLHAASGGIIPENAAREQIKYIIPVLVEALYQYSSVIWQKKATTKISYNEKFKIARDVLNGNIDKIAVTHGPGLIGSLLVGVEAAKTLSYIFKKPLIPVNHLLGHLYANFINTNHQIPTVKDFPVIGLIVSGNHTDLLLFQTPVKYAWLGGTRDDAAGEAFDKTGRLLGLAYPAGPMIEKRAQFGNPKRFRFPRPLHDSGDFDFSFSGLKTAVYREVQKQTLDEQTINDICRGIQDAIIESLVKKTLTAITHYQVKSLLLGGGVAANQTLKNMFELTAKSLKLKTKIFSPEKIYCTDNAAMIGTAAFFSKSKKDWKNLTADPELYFSRAETGQV